VQGQFGIKLFFSSYENALVSGCGSSSALLQFLHFRTLVYLNQKKSFHFSFARTPKPKFWSSLFFLHPIKLESHSPGPFFLHKVRFKIFLSSLLIYSKGQLFQRETFPAEKILLWWPWTNFFPWPFQLEKWIVLIGHFENFHLEPTIQNHYNLKREKKDFFIIKVLLSWDKTWLTQNWTVFFVPKWSLLRGSKWLNFSHFLVKGATWKPKDGMCFGRYPRSRIPDQKPWISDVWQWLFGCWRWFTTPSNISLSKNVVTFYFRSLLISCPLPSSWEALS